MIIFQTYVDIYSMYFKIKIDRDEMYAYYIGVFQIDGAQQQKINSLTSFFLCVRIWAPL